MSKGLYSGTVMVGVEQTLLGGKFPWTLHHGHADHECLRPASECEPIDYPKADGKLTFDRLSLGIVVLQYQSARRTSPST